MELQFAAVLGVKDERELLPHCIAHLRGLGVGLVMVIDCGSSDGSVEWVQANADENLQLHHFSDQNPDASGWERLNLELARSSNADWVLFLDADEFWISRTGSLHDCRGLADADVFNVRRFNVPIGPAGVLAGAGGVPSHAEDLHLIVEPVPDFRSRIDSEPELPWIRGVPGPKIMARPSGIGGLADGGHGLRPKDGARLRERTPDDLLVAHLPFSTLERFERKLRNVRRVFEVHDEYFGEHLAWHWRRWLALADAQAVRREFERQGFDAATLEHYLAVGVVKRASDWFDDRESGRGA